MKTRHSTLAILAVLSLATAGNLFAQRRTTSGGGSTGRTAPSGGGSSTSGGGGDRRGSGSGSGSGSTARPRDGGGSQPSARGQSEGGNSARGTTSSDRPASGKIAAVKARARDVAARTRRGGGVIYGGGVYIGSCWDCGYWGYYGPRWGWYDRGWWYPSRRHYPRDDYDHDRYDSRDDARDENADLGQGYMPYPYAESDGTGETFVRSRTAERRSYGAITGLYFTDVGSTTRAGHITLEGAFRSIHADIGYDQYAEPVAGGTDRLQTARFSVGVQPALGKQAYLIAAFGARGVFLGGGQNGGGPEGTLGLQVFPVRPLGINVTGRLAGVSFTGSNYLAMTELNTTGSVFLGRVELQAGWHWMRIEGSPAFAGPVVGTRLWF